MVVFSQTKRITVIRKTCWSSGTCPSSSSSLTLSSSTCITDTVTLYNKGKVCVIHPSAGSATIRLQLGAFTTEIHSRVLLRKGQEFCGYSCSLFKITSDFEPEASLIHHYANISVPSPSVTLNSSRLCWLLRRAPAKHRGPMTAIISNCLSVRHHLHC